MLGPGIPQPQQIETEHVPPVVVDVPVVVEVVPVLQPPPPDVPSSTVAVNPYGSAIPLISLRLGVSQRDAILSKPTDLSHLDYTATHFFTFIDSRRVAVLWKIFETPYLNSNPAFVEEAQNRLLLVLNHQRESPGNSETNSGGFSDMMLLLDTATTADVKDVTFRTLIPMSIVGDKMWRKLQSLFRPDGENNTGVAPIAAMEA